LHYSHGPAAQTQFFTAATRWHTDQQRAPVGIARTQFPE